MLRFGNWFRLLGQIAKDPNTARNNCNRKDWKLDINSHLKQIYRLIFKMMKKQCGTTIVRIHIRRTIRNPIVLYKAAAKTTVLSFFPTEINDIALKHIEFSLNQIIHGVQDTIILSAIENCLKALVGDSI